jgi:hypothetical protein
MAPPKRLRRSPQGAPPVARQSRFHGVPEWQWCDLRVTGGR